MFGGDNAIAFLQLRLRGGWKNLFTTSAVFGGALVAVIISAANIGRGVSAEYYRGWLSMLLVIQGLLLFLFGATRVTAAIRGDLNNRMIESHRLMPTTATQAVLGYIFGATSQATVMTGFTFVIGIFLAAAAGVPLMDWVLANAAMLACAVSTWSILAYMAFAFRTPFVWVLSLPLFTLFTNGSLWFVMPVLTLFWSPLAGPSLFKLGSVEAHSTMYLTSLMIQIAFGAICFQAAVRKYSRDDAMGMSPLLGLLLLAVAAASSWYGMAHWSEFEPTWYRARTAHLQVIQLVVSLLTLLVLAIIPVASAARQRSDYEFQSKNPALGQRLRRPLPVLVVVLLATAMISAIPTVLPSANADAFKNIYGAQAVQTRPIYMTPFDPDDEVQNVIAVPQVWVAMAVVVYLALKAYAFVLGAALRRGKSAGLAGTIWIALAWLGPVIANVVYVAVTDDFRTDRDFGIISCASPAGAVTMLWRDHNMNHIVVAIGSQLLIALIAGIVYFSTPVKQAAITAHGKVATL